MIIKNEILEQSNNPECKSSLTSGYRLCLSFLIVCLSAPLGHTETLSADLDPINLLESSSVPSSQNTNTSSIREDSNTPLSTQQSPIQTTKLQPDQWQRQTNSDITTNFAAHADKKSSHLLIAKGPTTDLSRQLWQARITNPKDRKSGKSKSELYQMIEKIRSVKFESKDKPAELLIVVEPLQETKPNEIPSDINVSEEPKAKETETKPEIVFDSKQQGENQLLCKPVTEETLQILNDISQHSQQLKKPLKLAEILFRSGCLKEAAKCYQEALNRMTANDTDKKQTKAWILFQIGNCLRNNDPPKAMEMYRQLIAQYHDSPWVNLAKARSKLINWYQQHKPRALIDENRF